MEMDKGEKKVQKNVTTIGVVGTSNITEKFISVVKDCPLLGLKAVYSRSMEKAERFAAKHGIEKCFDNLETMAEDSELDAVYIASPNFMHHRQSILFLQHGKHVLCEKSAAVNYREIWEMVDTAHRNQVVFLEAMRSSYDPGFRVVRENLNKLGKIRMVKFSNGRYSSKYDGFLEGKPQNIFSPECAAGALLDMGVYCVHPLIELFGMPDQVQASCVKLSNGIDGAGTFLALYPEMLAEVSYSKISNGRMESEIQGEKGTMFISEIMSPRKAVIEYVHGGVEELVIPPCENNMCYEAEYFARAIQEHTDVTAHQQVSLDSTRLMDEVRRQQNLIFPVESPHG